MTKILNSHGRRVAVLCAVLLTAAALRAADLPAEPEKLTSAEAVDAYLAVAEDAEQTPARRNYAAMQIIRRGKKALPRIVELYPVGSVERRGLLADVLGAMKDPGEDATKLLLDDLKKHGLRVHPNVMRALGEMNVTDAADVMVVLLPKASGETRRVMLAALGRLADARAADAFFTGLESSDRLLRMTCADAVTRLLARIKPRTRAVKKDHPYRKVLDRTLEVIRDGTHVDARRFLITGMSRVRDPQASRTLIHMLRNRENSLRVAAADTLGKLKEQDAVDDLIGLTKSSNDTLRRAALRALGTIGDDDCVPRLIDRMEEVTAKERRDILVALRQITGERFGDNPDQWRRWWDKKGI